MVLRLGDGRHIEESNVPSRISAISRVWAENTRSVRTARRERTTALKADKSQA